MDDKEKAIQEYKKRVAELNAFKEKDMEEYHREGQKIQKQIEECKEHNFIEYSETILTMENSDTPIGKVVWEICSKCFGLFSKRYSFKSKCPFCDISLLINEWNTNDKQIDFRCEKCNYQEIIMR